MPRAPFHCRLPVPAALTAVAVGMAGCVSPSAPPPPPGGGQRLVLSYAGYESLVAPVIARHGCDAGGDCHGGGIRGTLQLSPATAKNGMYDFDQLVLQVNPVHRDSSALLLRPLADEAGGRPHPTKAFASAADSDYVAVRGWIQAGVLQ